MTPIKAIPAHVIRSLEALSSRLRELAQDIGQLPCGMVPADDADRARLASHASDVIDGLAATSDELRDVIALLSFDDDAALHCRHRPAARLVASPARVTSS